jgi:hypothetical protein
MWPWHQVDYEIHQNNWFRLGRRSRMRKLLPVSIFSPSPFMGNVSEKFKLPEDSVWQVKCYISADIIIGIIGPRRGKSIITGKSLNVQFISG